MSLNQDEERLFNCLYQEKLTAVQQERQSNERRWTWANEPGTVRFSRDREELIKYLKALFEAWIQSRIEVYTRVSKFPDEAEIKRASDCFHLHIDREIQDMSDRYVGLYSPIPSKVAAQRIMDSLVNELNSLASHSLAPFRRFVTEGRVPVSQISVHNDVLKFIHDLGKGFVRNPSTYEGKGEEAIRDLIVQYLQARYPEYAVLGEPQNKKGKADILVRYQNDNLLVAECKLWKGPASFSNAISQLLGYFTWKDKQAALILFVQNTKISTAVTSVKNNTPKHPNYCSFVMEQDQGWLNYEFNLEGDPKQAFKLAIMLIHIPKLKGTSPIDRTK